MTIQEAYNKGLDDAEFKVIDTFCKLLLDEECQPFPNPKMEIIKTIIKERSDLFIEFSKRNNNFGKAMRKKIENQRKILQDGGLI